jgi:hypothetical protein
MKMLDDSLLIAGAGQVLSCSSGQQVAQLQLARFLNANVLAQPTGKKIFNPTNDAELLKPQHFSGVEGLQNAVQVPVQYTVLITMDSHK